MTWHDLPLFFTKQLIARRIQYPDAGVRCISISISISDLIYQRMLLSLLNPWGLFKAHALMMFQDQCTYGLILWSCPTVQCTPPTQGPLVKQTKPSVRSQSEAASCGYSILAELRSPLVQESSPPTL